MVNVAGLMEMVVQTWRDDETMRGGGEMQRNDGGRAGDSFPCKTLKYYL